MNHKLNGTKESVVEGAGKTVANITEVASSKTKPPWAGLGCMRALDPSRDVAKVILMTVKHKYQILGLECLKLSVLSLSDTKIHHSVDNFIPTAINSLDNLWEDFVDAFVVGK